MDSSSELLITFKSLQKPARHNLLSQLSPEDAIILCNTDRETRKLCKEDYDVWIERINKECPEYQAVGENVNNDNAYNKYVECKRERKKLASVSDPYRFELIEQGNILDFIRSDPKRDINYFIWACMFGQLNIAKWFHRKFNLTNEEIRTDYNAAFKWACENKHYHVTRWLYDTFDLNLNMINANMIDCLPISPPNLMSPFQGRLADIHPYYVIQT